MKRRRVNWPHGNPAFGAWQFETPAGLIVARRNHPVVRRGERLCQGWDIWLDGEFVGTLGSRPFGELPDLSRTGLLRAVSLCFAPIPPGRFLKRCIGLQKTGHLIVSLRWGGVPLGNKSRSTEKIGSLGITVVCPNISGSVN